MKRNSLLQLWICSPNKIFQYNTRDQSVKAYNGFDPRHYLGGLNATKGPQLTGPHSKVEFAFNPYLIFTSWHLWNRRILKTRSSNFVIFSVNKKVWLGQYLQPPEKSADLSTKNQSLYFRKTFEVFPRVPDLTLST